MLQAEAGPDPPQMWLLVPADCWISLRVPGQVSCIKNQQFTGKLQKEANKNPKPFPSPLWKELRDRVGFLGCPVQEQELDSVILMDTFQLSLLHGSVILQAA